MKEFLAVEYLNVDLTFLCHTHWEKMMYSSLLGFSKIHDEVSTLLSV